MVANYRKLDPKNAQDVDDIMHQYGAEIDENTTYYRTKNGTYFEQLNRTGEYYLQICNEQYLGTFEEIMVEIDKWECENNE